MDFAPLLSALRAVVDGEDAAFFQAFAAIKAPIHAAQPAPGPPFLDLLDPVPADANYKLAGCRDGFLSTCVALASHKLGLPVPSRADPVLGEKRAILVAVCVALAATGLPTVGIDPDQVIAEALAPR
jgi:hypothetical protein